MKEHRFNTFCLQCVFFFLDNKFNEPVILALFKTIWLWIQLRLARPRSCFNNIARALRIRTQGFRRENGASSRIQSRSRGFEKGLRSGFS